MELHLERVQITRTWPSMYFEYLCCQVTLWISAALSQAAISTCKPWLENRHQNPSLLPISLTDTEVGYLKQTVYCLFALQGECEPHVATELLSTELSLA